MKKNGSYFLSVVEPDVLRTGVWDPYSYREQLQSDTFGHFASAHKVQGRSHRAAQLVCSPIEYRHIHRGLIPVFTLEHHGRESIEPFPVVGEGCLLFGTMRAYLGNAIVTPKAVWLGEASPMFFPVKSEFVHVIPNDGFVYFWWAFLQSQKFLQCLPVGSGGTRPRLDREHLLRTPVEVPSQEVRKTIHARLATYAERAWHDYMQAKELLNSMTR